MRLRSGDPEAIGGYPLERRLGAGGMGTVYLARTASGRRVAIKLIHRQYADDEEFRTRFRQEVSAARRVSGAFTAAVVDADPEGEHPWMATAYIEGPTLSQRITDEGPLGGRELRTLAVGLTEALRDIHRAGVVHRDLKPSNVVLSGEGPRVIDFGISRAADNQTLTMTGRVIGTPPFMSPEQLQSPRDVSASSDVFSLGTLLVYAATGQGPFDADSPYMTAYQVVHEAPELGAVPEPLRRVVEPCLSKDPAGRPSAGELLAGLLALPEEFGAPTAAADAGARGPHDTETRLLSGAGRRSGTETTAAPGERGRGRTAIGRGLRTRWRAVLAAAVAVAAIAGGVALLRPGGGDGQDAAQGADGGPRSVTATGEALPAGFKPWQVTVRGGADVPDELRCEPHAGALYCGGGGVVATRLKVSNGKAEWTVKSPGVPTVGMHLVGVTGSGADTAVVGYRQPALDSGGPSKAVALTQDGEELWSTPLGSGSAVLLGRTQEAVLHRGAVLSVDAAGTRIESRAARGDGSPRWTTPFPAGTECTPYAAGPDAERLYAVCAPQAEETAGVVRNPVVHTIDPDSGELGAAVRLKGRLRPAGEADGALVLVEDRYQGAEFTGWSGVAVLDPRTGGVRRHPVRQASGADPAVVGGTLYFTARDGRVSAVDPDTGRQKWSRQTGVEWASGPAAADGVLYFSSASGRVAALSARDGDRLWSTDPRAESPGGEARATGRVKVSGRAVFVTAAGNTVFGIDAKRPPEVE
ncbi:protein kinase [Streptomyces monticola]|uniref:Protein kinase n=1 Tax=Streptomyces monticola TaxID=2666263 RepID=A0ABW2JRR1_9ACTN